MCIRAKTPQTEGLVLAEVSGINWRSWDTSSTDQHSLHNRKFRLGGTCVHAVQKPSSSWSHPPAACAVPLRNGRPTCGDTDISAYRDSGDSVASLSVTYAARISAEAEKSLHDSSDSHLPGTPLTSLSGPGTVMCTTGDTVGKAKGQGPGLALTARWLAKCPPVGDSTIFYLTNGNVNLILFLPGRIL